MSKFPPASQITNAVQTLALMILSALAASGRIPPDSVNLLAAGIGGIALVVYNVLNHDAALKAPPHVPHAEK